MLTNEQKKYIRDNYRTMTAHAMSVALGKHHGTVERFLKRSGLTPLAANWRKHSEIKFKCEPPLSCFNCPFTDCVKAVTEVKRTALEDVYAALGFVDTIGQGNGRKRV